MMLITISLRRKVSRDQSRLSQLSDLFPEEDDIHVPRLPNKLRLIPKQGCSFQFEMSGYSFTFPGACIDSKPAERITKKLKNKFPCDF